MSAGLDPIEFIPGLTIGTIELDFIEQTRAFCHQSLSGRQGLMESFYEMTVAPPDRCVDLYGRCLSHVARLEELRTTGYFAVRRPHKSVLSDLSLALREQSAVATSAAFDPQAVGEGVCPRFRHGTDPTGSPGV